MDAYHIYDIYALVGLNPTYVLRITCCQRLECTEIFPIADQFSNDSTPVFNVNIDLPILPTLTRGVELREDEQELVEDIIAQVMEDDQPLTDAVNFLTEHLFQRTVDHDPLFGRLPSFLEEDVSPPIDLYYSEGFDLPDDTFSFLCDNVLDEIPFYANDTFNAHGLLTASA